MYEVGSKVKVKSIAELVTDYKVGLCGDVLCELSFAKGMRKYCGKILTVAKKEKLSSGCVVYKLTGEEGCEGWDFTSDMFKAV